MHMIRCHHVNVTSLAAFFSAAFLSFTFTQVLHTPCTLLLRNANVFALLQ